MRHPKSHSLAFLRRHLYVVIAFSIFSNLAALLPSLFMLQVYDRVLSSRSIETLWMLVFVSILGYGFSFGIEYARQLILSDTAVRFALLCREHGDMQQLLSTAAGKSSLGPANDIRLTEQFLSGHTVPLLLDAPWGIVFLLIIFLFDVRLGAVALAGVVLIALVALIGSKRDACRARSAQGAIQASEHASRIVQDQAELIAAVRAATGVLAAQRALRARERVLSTTAALSQSFYRSLGKCAQGGLQTAMLAVGAALVISHHASGGLMLAATILLGRVLQPLQGLLATWEASRDGVAALLRLKTWLSSIPATPAAEAMPECGRLAVEGVGFGYANANGPVLAHVSLAIEPGKLLFIQAASGSGKTTLARLLAGLYHPQRGRITLGGIAPHTLSGASGAACIGLLPQDGMLLPGTVAENIGRTMHGTPIEVDQHAIEAAARLAGIHEWILTLPAGYRTHIGPGGLYLGHAERTFVELARCLYGAPRLVILDEPAAWLDETWRQKLLEAVKRMQAQDMAVLMLASHAPFTIAADQTAVLQHGRMMPSAAMSPEIPALIRPVVPAFVRPQHPGMP